jgi:multicomponent K+:H+ antiporter subunit A
VSLLGIILLPLLVGTIATPLAARAGRSASAWTAAIVAGASLALTLSLAPRVFAGEPVAATWQWLPSAGLSISLRLDGLALLFCLLILGVGLLIILYARYYLSDSDPIGRFYAFLMLFMAAMLGVALSDNLLLFAVFWELTSLASFLLIGYWHEEQDARRGARMALAVTGGGGLAMLAGFILLGQIAGTYEISDMIGRRADIQSHALFPVALVLVLLGAFTKSAQFPFHFWLPEAMAAPTPVSAYLHSATMVKAGVFLVARLYPVIGDNLLFEFLVVGAGLVTMVYAAFVAMFQHDLKGLLAYSTVSNLGLIMFLLGLDTPLSAVAAVFHVVNHATFKASLFMAAGIIDHECGTRDMRRINGLAKYMPYTATLAIVAALAMAGVPLLNGFLSKEMFFAETVDIRGLPVLGAIAPYAATLGAAFSVAYSVRFIHDVFFNGEPRDLPRTPHEPPRWMKVPVEVLVLVCVAVGLAPSFTVQPLVDLAAASVLAGKPPLHTLAIWHGLNLPLAMSFTATVAGILLYAYLQRDYGLHKHTPPTLSGKRIFEEILAAVLEGASRLTAGLANGSLQRYVGLVVLAAVMVGVAAFAGHGYSTGTRALLPAGPLDFAGWLLACIAAVAAVVVHRARVLGVIMVGVVGLVVSLAFIRLSAPDLALTQLSVEIVSTVLLLMGLALLPWRSPAESTRGRRWRDAGLAAAAGSGVTALAWAMMTRPLEPISWYFLEKSLPEGGGTNVVNVILVDFRGFDTLGEITVLGIAAMGVAALLDGMRAMRPSAAPDGRPWSTDAFPLMLQGVARMLLPFALLVSVYIFLRGHNLPGGGFIAGLVTSIALVMQYMALGLAETEARLRLRFDRMIGIGLLVAIGTGLASFAFDAPFLTSAHGHPRVPLLGEIPLASAALFDLGVYLGVVGATLLTLVTLGHATRRA